MGTKNPPRYLFIGGAPKSGTTSIFNYLSDHPEACPANRKETYFFAREFDLRKVCRAQGMTAEEFQRHFTHCKSAERVRIEATPYTLYAKDSARHIDAALPESTMLFVLRDPVQRLLSDYRMHHYRGHPSAKGSIDDFIRYQRRADEGGKMPSLIRLGCYSEFLRPYFDIFGRERVWVTFFEELVQDPAAEMKRLCNFLEIEGGFYSAYRFRAYNPSIRSRSGRLAKISMRLEPVVAGLKSRLIQTPQLHRVFHAAIDKAKFAYLRLNNNRREQRPEFPQAVLDELAEYYRSHNERLAQALGRELPW